MTTHSDPRPWRDLVIVPLQIPNESLWGAGKKKKKSSECVCVHSSETTEEREGIIWADVDENGIDHISLLLLTVV